MKKTLFLASLFAGSVFTTNAQSVILSEGFDDITTLETAGWVFSNQSDPIGVTDWFQGNINTFYSHEGANNSSYIGANFNNTAGSIISNWLITPVLDLKNGDEISFWTRTPTGSTFNDRLEVRSSVGTMTMPSGADGTGSFTNVHLIINDDYDLSYPEEWTQYTITISDLSDTPVAVNFAFRYNVEDGGPQGYNSNYIGIDTFLVTEQVASVDNHLTSLFSVYPNPTNNILNLSSQEDISNVVIVDMLGKTVYQNNFSNNEISIDISDLQSAMYFVKVTTSGQVSTIKIIKE